MISWNRAVAESVFAVTDMFMIPGTDASSARHKRP